VQSAKIQVFSVTSVSSCSKKRCSYAAISREPTDWMQHPPRTMNGCLRSGFFPKRRVTKSLLWSEQMESRLGALSNRHGKIKSLNLSPRTLCELLFKKLFLRSVIQPGTKPPFHF
jgi:hypothetical protein